MAYYSRDKLLTFGLTKAGKNVLLSKQASLYNYGKILIDNNVRIDDFCILSAEYGGIEIDHYIHIAPYYSLIGAGKIKLSDCGPQSISISTNLKPGKTRLQYQIDMPVQPPGNGDVRKLAFSITDVELKY